jgi:mRNA interferase MazF
VPWPFRDNKGTKVRPVVVLSNEKYSKSFADFIGVAVTSNLDMRPYGSLDRKRA